MRYLILILAMFATQALATNSKPPVPAPPIAAPQQTQAQQQAIDMSLYANPLSSSGISNGHTYVFPPPAAAAPLPSGLCPQGDSESWSVVWGFVSYAKSSMRTEMDCLDKLLKHAREMQPKPVQTVVNYISPPPVAEPVVCKMATPIAGKKKSVGKPSACRGA